MENLFELLRAVCPECGGTCTLSIELIEKVQKMAIDSDIDDLSDIDALVKEAIEGNHNHDAKFKEPVVPFPVALDVENNQLCFITWCSKCKDTRIVGMTPNEIIGLLKSARDSR